jgi:hypothetical protein
MRDPFMDREDHRTDVRLAIGAAAVLVSGWVHFSLYFRGGYRGIAPESVIGLTVSRSFALNAVAAVVIAESLVLATRFRRWVLPAAAAGVLFALATIVAYVLSRTTGLLGFEESTTSTEAVVALVAEVVTVAALTPVAVSSTGRRRTGPVAATA